MGGVSRWTSPHSARRVSICDPSAALGLVVGGRAPQASRVAADGHDYEGPK